MDFIYSLLGAITGLIIVDLFKFSIVKFKQKNNELGGKSE